jgi:hypothetical protein
MSKSLLRSKLEGTIRTTVPSPPQASTRRFLVLRYLRNLNIAFAVSTPHYCIIPGNINSTKYPRTRVRGRLASDQKHDPVPARYKAFHIASPRVLLLNAD